MPNKKTTDPHAEIEQAQRQLRQNIEDSKQLVEKTSLLLEKGKSGRAPGE